MVIDPLLYLGATSSGFLNILSQVLLYFGVTLLVACISVWLYVTSSRLYGYTLASSSSSQPCNFMSPCVCWTLMDVSVTSSICACLFMSRSNLFQTFGIFVSPHIPYNYQITPGISTSTVSWSCDVSCKGYWDLLHCMTPTWWSSKLFLYSAWWFCFIMLTKFLQLLAALLNLCSDWRHCGIIPTKFVWCLAALLFFYVSWCRTPISIAPLYVLRHSRPTSQFL